MVRRKIDGSKAGYRSSMGREHLGGNKLRRRGERGKGRRGGRERREKRGSGGRRGEKEERRQGEKGGERERREKGGEERGGEERRGEREKTEWVDVYIWAHILFKPLGPTHREVGYEANAIQTLSAALCCQTMRQQSTAPDTSSQLLSTDAGGCVLARIHCTQFTRSLCP